MGDHTKRNPEKERKLRATAMESLRDLRVYYTEIHWTQGMKNIGKAISLIEWLKLI